MRKHAYGHRPLDIGTAELGSGWIRGIRHLASRSAKDSFWHRHSETSIICCLRGEYTYELHNLPSLMLTAGSFLVVPAQVEHRHLMAVDPVGDRLEILLTPNPQHVLRHSAFDPDTCRSLHAALLKKALTPVKCSKPLLEICKELYMLTGETSKGLTQEQIGLARILCQHILYKMSRPMFQIEKHAIIPFAEIVAWLEAHLSEKIDINRIVAHIGYSRTQTFTFFHENCGLTPVDFLMRLRIKKAQTLLETTTHTVQSIADRCGFSTASAFNAVFRKQTGLTPLSWRIKHRNLPTS